MNYIYLSVVIILLLIVSLVIFLHKKNKKTFSSSNLPQSLRNACFQEETAPSSVYGDLASSIQYKKIEDDNCEIRPRAKKHHIAEHRKAGILELSVF